MRQVGLAALVVACLMALLAACFGSVLVRDRQFAYRDAASYYLPLHERVQAEWRAGRWPLWEPEENGGMPLLGNPTAAVLYPGKVVFALLPLDWAIRVEVVAHAILAAVGMIVLMRTLGAGAVGSSLAALAYAFGAPVLFQYCNVIYLVGAAWAPFGLAAAHQLVMGRRRGAIVALATVLALQALGGDPESAYLVVLWGLVLAVVRAGNRSTEAAADSRGRGIGRGVALVLLVLLWILVCLGLAAAIKLGEGQRSRASAGEGFSGLQAALAVLWLGAGLGIGFLGRTRPALRDLARSLILLASATLLALGLGAAQLLPVAEYAGLSGRVATGSSHDLFPFSVELSRAVEFVWPGFFGSLESGETDWLGLVPPRHLPKRWTWSLYLGGLTLVLAARGASLGARRGRAPGRAWLTVIALLSLLGAFGEYAGPLWWARALPSAQGVLGVHDPTIYDPPRTDGGVPDGFGSVYGLLATLLPGFRLFRFPGKLLTFAALGIAGLAGLGWDRLREPGSGRVPAVLLTISALALGLVLLGREPLERLARSAAGETAASVFGPFDPAGAVAAAGWALAHGGLVMAACLGLARASQRGRPGIGPLALLLLTIDLAIANAPLVITVPQAVFDAEPRLLTLIRQAERRDPADGPFRIHRMPTWYPAAWSAAGSARRHEEITRWEYDTLTPRYAIRGGLSYALTDSPMERGDLRMFFQGLEVPIDTRLVPLRGAVDGQPVLYYTRRGFDLWGVRYFVLPMDPGTWREPGRGFAAFLAHHEPIAPDPRLFQDDAAHRAELDRWIVDQDWQLLRNRSAYPRAWLVHQARFLEPIRHPGSDEHAALMLQMLFPGDELWSGAARRVFDPHTFAWIETGDRRPLLRYAPGGPPDPDERVRVVRHEPQRVEIEARLNRRGFVILADSFYPGWTLRIDGRPAPLLRANRLMRAAAVEPGLHRLEYTYRPLSFRIGLLLSLASLAGALLLGAWAWRTAPAATTMRRQPSHGPEGMVS